MAASSDEASGDWPPGTIVCENRGLGRVWSRWMPMPEMSFRKGDSAGEWS